MTVLECSCGALIGVEEYEAGASKVCLECNEALNVPSLSKLRILEGESNPYLDSTSRLMAAIQDSRPPFDGNCIRCSQPATVEYPVSTRFLKERISADLPINVGLTGDVMFDFSAEEKWVRLKIPFRFCNRCKRDFRRRVLVGRLLMILGLLAAIGIGIPVLVLTHVLGAIFFLPLIWGISQVASRVKVERRLEPYLQQHSVLRTVFSSQEELVVRIGWPRKVR